MKLNFKKLLKNRLKELSKALKEAKVMGITPTYGDFLFGRLEEVKQLLRELENEGSCVPDSRDNGKARRVLY